MRHRRIDRAWNYAYISTFLSQRGPLPANDRFYRRARPPIGEVSLLADGERIERTRKKLCELCGLCGEY